MFEFDVVFTHLETQSDARVCFFLSHLLPHKTESNTNLCSYFPFVFSSIIKAACPDTVYILLLPENISPCAVYPLLSAV